MNVLQKMKKVISNPLVIVSSLGFRGRLKWIPDKVYLKIIFKSLMNKSLDLKNPISFNEKLQYLKLYDRSPLYTNLVDKYEVRKYISKTIGDEYLIPLIGVWESFDHIDFDKLPEQFVLKCNHDSGGVIICKDKNKLDINGARKKINKYLKRNYFYPGREWPYKNINPIIICEKYLEDRDYEDLKDFKVLCFGGKPKLIEIHNNRFSNHTQDYYDCDWNKTDLYGDTPNSNFTIKKPILLEKMLDLSRIISTETKFVRIDWYIVSGQLYFGEITFYPASGYNGYNEENNELLGAWIKI